MNKYRRGFMRVAFEIFVLSVVSIVVLHSFVYGRGLHFEYSISRYVGLDWWSAAIFGICNFVVCEMVFRYLRQINVHWKMSWIWWVSALAMLVGLIGLSVCPVGLFDAEWGDYGVVSILHQIFSKVMFVFAIITAFETTLKFRSARLIKYVGMAFVVYGVACAILLLTNNVWFNNNLLVFESSFIIGYLFMLLCIPEYVSGNKELDD